MTEQQKTVIEYLAQAAKDQVIDFESLNTLETNLQAWSMKREDEFRLRITEAETKYAESIAKAEKKYE